MNMKSLGLLAVAAVCGLVAMLGVMQVLQGKGTGKAEQTVSVLVAAVDITPGMPLDENNVGLKEMPVSAVPAGAVTDVKQILGKTLVSRAVPGEILMDAKLGGADAITPSHQIPAGQRIATVSVNATTSHSGLIRPTDRVDVICSYKMQDSERRQSTRVKTILEFIEVFAVDAVRTERDGEVGGAIKNVSLLVSPEQSQLLTAAEQLGELHLSLRNRTDQDRLDVAELSDRSFFEKEISAGDRSERQTASEPSEIAPISPEFLTSVTATAAPIAPAVPEVPKWTMMIGNGETLHDVEVLDETALPAEMSIQERQRLRAEWRQQNEAVAPPAAPPAVQPLTHR